MLSVISPAESKIAGKRKKVMKVKRVKRKKEPSEEEDVEMRIPDNIVGDDAFNEDSGNEVDNENSGNEVDNEDSGNEVDNENSGNEDNGNEGWADAMAKILGGTSKIILAKAKREGTSQLQKIPDFSVVGSSDVKDEQETTPQDTALPLNRRRLLKSEKKKAWESLGRKRPNPAEKESERNLMRIATRGVVQLFNAVKQQQATLEGKLKTAGASERKREVVIKDFNKGAFLDLLKGTTATKEEKSENSTDSKSTWDALRNDFMLHAKMKDWDKEGEIIS